MSHEPMPVFSSSFFLHVSLKCGAVYANVQKSWIVWQSGWSKVMGGRHFFFLQFPLSSLSQYSNLLSFTSVKIIVGPQEVKNPPRRLKIRRFPMAKAILRLFEPSKSNKYQNVEQWKLHGSFEQYKGCSIQSKNIARGTTDPGYRVYN